MSTDNTLINENVKVKKLIKGLEGSIFSVCNDWRKILKRVRA